MKAQNAKLSRRKFLLVAGAGTAATAAALVAKNPAQPGLVEEKVGESKKGYQLTEHVRNYYRTAKV